MTKKFFGIVCAGLLLSQLGLAAVEVECEFLRNNLQEDRGPVRQIGEDRWVAAQLAMIRNNTGLEMIEHQDEGDWNFFLSRVDLAPDTVRTGVVLLDRMTYRNGGLLFGRLVESLRYSCQVTVSDEDGDVMMGDVSN